MDFNTLDDFMYIEAHDRGYLGPISWTCCSVQNTLKGIYKSTLRWFLNLSKVSLNVKFGF